MIGESDELVWNFNDEGGVFTTKLGYISGLLWELGTNKNWGNAFWKISAPLKSKVIVWLVLNNKELTWDIFQQRSF